MAYKDDDELTGASYSNADRWSKADRGERQELQRQIREKQGRDLSQQELTLKTEIELRQLEQRLAGKQDDETKRVQKPPPETFGTKTLKQEEEEQILTGDEKITSEDLLREEKRQQQAEEEGEVEQQSQPG